MQMMPSYLTYRALIVAVCSLLVLFGVVVLAQDATPEATSLSESSPFDIPPEIANNADEWPLANYDYANTRAAHNSAIDSSNVNTLGVAWTFNLKGVSGWGAAAGAPVIADGVVYMQDLGANTFAIDLETGEAKWEALYHNGLFGPVGPGIGYGKVYVYSRLDRLTALDINTGEELWHYGTGMQSAGGAFQPSAFDHNLYVTTQAAVSGNGAVEFHSYQGGSSGVAFILNPETGEKGWQWVAVEEGFWGHPEVNSGGGIWFPPAIDIITGHTYWTTGNPSPVPGIKAFPNGSSRPGPNLYTNSLVALDHLTGEMLWYNQVKPHDLFNLDFQASPMLATVTIDGENRDIIIGSGKFGRILGFDRATGETLWDTPVGLHQNDELQELIPGETVWVAPGAWGGVETPMAYADGVVYALVANLPSPYEATANGANTPEEALNQSEGGTLYENGTAEVDALDAATGEILWRTEFDRIAFGGVTVVNDLVFTATLDGTIYALSRDDGSIVWQYQASGGTNAWPAVAGDTIVWPIGIGDSPHLLALKLGAHETVPTPEPYRTPVQTPQGG
jgi:outer membrane protein assembly factor BamB